jgi:hypothetical protein
VVNWSKLGISLASGTLVCVVSLFGFLFVLLAPTLAFELAYGRASVEGAPGHGAAFVFWCGPIAAAAAFFAGIFLSIRFYRNLSGLRNRISDLK